MFLVFAKVSNKSGYKGVEPLPRLLRGGGISPFLISKTARLHLRDGQFLNTVVGKYIYTMKTTFLKLRLNCLQTLFEYQVCVVLGTAPFTLLPHSFTLAHCSV